MSNLPKPLLQPSNLTSIPDHDYLLPNNININKTNYDQDQLSEEAKLKPDSIAMETSDNCQTIVMVTLPKLEDISKMEDEQKKMDNSPSQPEHAEETVEQSPPVDTEPGPTKLDLNSGRIAKKMVSEAKIKTGGTKVYHIDDGFYYFMHKIEKPRFYMKCVYAKKTQCPGRMSMPENVEERTVENARQGKIPHNHPTMRDWFLKQSTRYRLFERSSTETTNYSTLFKEETAKLPAKIAGELAKSFKPLRQAMYRARKKAKLDASTNVMAYEEVESEAKALPAVLVKPGSKMTRKKASRPKKKVNLGVCNSDLGAGNLGFFFEEFAEPHESCSFNMVKRIIVDTDAGIDDAWAILMLLAAEKDNPNINVVGITCSHGNTTVDHTYVNVLRTLEAAGRLDIPVFKGAASPLIDWDEHFKSTRKPFFGEDGFGCADHDSPIVIAYEQEENAVAALSRMASEDKGDISLLCLGPLTNIALAIRTYSDFAKNIKECLIMGGNYKGVGNTTDSAEFNFYADPEAAHIVLNSEIPEKTLVPWETCLDATFTLDYRDSELGASDSAAIQLMNRVERPLRAKPSFVSWMCCDQVAAGVLLIPTLATSSASVHATVELHGQYTRGQVVLSHKLRRESNLTLVQAVDNDLLKILLLNIHNL